MGANNAYGSGIPIPLSWNGSDSKTVTPTTGVTDHKCDLRSLPLKEREHNLVALRIVVEADLSINQPASGASTINYDKLAKAIESVGLWLPEIGYYFPHQHTAGALQVNVNQVIANGYRRRGIQDAPVPTTDAVHARTVRLELPFALPILTEEMDTSFPMALLEGGRLEVKIAANTIFGTDSTGATLDNVVLRAWIEAIPVSKMWVPGLYGFRSYSMGGGVSNYRIDGIGSSGLSIAQEGCGLAAIYMILNPAGLGLGGSTTADNVTGLNSPDLDIPDLNHLPALYEMFERQIDAENNTATRWPYSASTSTFGNGKVSGAMILPIRMPTRGQFLSRMRRINRDKDLKLKYTFTTPPSGEMKHGTLEFYAPTAKLEQMVREAYKLGGDTITAPKTASGKPISDGTLHSLRYGPRQVFYSGVSE